MEFSDIFNLYLDPFFIISYQNGIVLYRSEVIPKTLEPSWKEFELVTSTNINKDALLYLDVFVSNFLGFFITIFYNLLFFCI